MQIEGLKEPDHNGGDKDNGKRSLQEIFCLVPQKMSHIFRSGKAVIGKLHYEGNRLAAEHGLPQEKGHENSHYNAAEIQGDHHQRAVFREKGRCEEGVDRKLRRAAHKRRQKDGHPAVPL